MPKPKNKIIVNKFGGGIMIKKHIPFSQERLNEQISAGYKPIVVVSALKGVTDEILLFLCHIKKKIRRNQRLGGSSEKYIDSLIKPFVRALSEKHLNLLEEVGVSRDWRKNAMDDLDKIFKNLENDLIILLRFGFMNLFDDKITAYGERLASIFYAYYLKSLGIEARAVFAEEIPIITDDCFKNANIIFDISEKNALKSILNIKEIPVIPGFTGETLDGNTTTLGRGGTDTTACFLGAALKAEKVILWKDVEGVLSADPKIVKEAITVPFVSYAEAAESGKIIHDKAIQYIKMFQTTAEVAAITDPSKKTLVGPYVKRVKGAKIVSLKKDLSLLVITDDRMNGHGYLANITRILTSHKVNLDITRNTRDKLLLVAENGDGKLDEAIHEIKKQVKKLEVTPVNMVVLIGSLDWKTVNRFNDILIKLCPKTELGAFPYRDCVRLEAVVKTEEMEKMVRALHKEFIG